MSFTITSAQEPTAEQLQQQIEDSIRYHQSPKQRINWEADQLATSRSSWNGQGTWMPLQFLMRSGAEDELGLTDDQKKRLSLLYLENNMGMGMSEEMRQKIMPKAIALREAGEATMIPGDPNFERATEEQKDAYREVVIASVNLFTSALQTEIQETLTSEQMLKVRKLEMQLMPVMGIPFPSMFDPLDLTDDQKKEMNKIADEMKAEFDRLTLEEAMLKSERLAATYGSLRGQTFASQEEFQKAQQDVHRQYVPSEELRKRYSDLRERGTKLTTTLQNRLMNVLTDEQLDKMQKILDETPEFAKKMIAQFKGQQEAQEKSPQYVPGPDSWRPGDPVPVQFKEERQRTDDRRTGLFPRGESE
jgi:hypothetical protein